MTKIEKEKSIAGLMVRIYCRHREGNRDLCPECSKLLEYARMRLDRCPHGELKPSCRRCTIHCYSPAMRERMKMVMRYAAPRMLLYHPIEAARHMLT